MKKLIVLIIVIFASFNLADAQILPELEKIKEIKLLESNREDVRRIFADYKLENDERRKYEDIFKTDNTKIEVTYSAGKCSEESKSWTVPQWKATKIVVSPKHSVKLKDTESAFLVFGTSFSKVRKEKIYSNNKNFFLYHDKNAGIAMKSFKDEIKEIEIVPSKFYFPLLCNKNEAEILSNNKSWFSKPLKERWIILDYADEPANVTNLNVMVSEIIAGCSLSDLPQEENCSDDVKTIEVSATAEDQENDALTFYFQVSVGKIIGNFEKASFEIKQKYKLERVKKVIWDLSGVKPGTYTITAAVDDGCGFCGKSMTKTVVVKECPNCKQN